MTHSQDTFSARVGRSKKVHAAKPVQMASRTMFRTACGFFGHDGWIKQAALEPVTCKSCLRVSP